MNSRGIQQFIHIARRLPPKYWVVIGVLAAGYFFAEPVLERSLGKTLPGFNDNKVVQAELDQREFEKTNNTSPGSTDFTNLNGGNNSGSNSNAKQDLNDLFDANRKSSNSSPDDRGNSGNSKSGSSLPNLATKPPIGSKSGSTGSSGSAKLGQLTETGRDVFETTAGLIFTPGSYEGHRLKHVLRHCEDQPNRQGSHGVFDGGKDGMLATLDEAYLKAKKGGRGIKKENQDGKTIYTVEMGRRIGFVGGQTGNRKNKPKATKVKLVLNGQKVITAYPTTY